ncbi:uncharacterized protein LOC125660370 isoform X3 [Ostrea edulis]|nr:uncharacterized protein LOC125660370 isoform X3 [Ostrea edulis]
MWNHVYIRRENDMYSSMFFNGSYVRTLSDTGLPSTISNLILNPNAGCQFTMVDFRFYSTYLTNREIQEEIFEGKNLSDTPISFPECRCPRSHPELPMSDNDPSGVFCKALENSDTVMRLRNKMEDSLRDDNSSSYWTGSSSDSSPAVYFTFDQVFMIDKVEISFESSHSPTNVEAKLFVQNMEKNSNNITSITSDRAVWELRSSPPSENSSRSEVEKMVADTIKIKFGQNVGSQVRLTEISIIGRCYCDGNSDSCYFYRCYCDGNSDSTCNITGRTFQCDCLSNRKVAGNSCELCKRAVYRKQEEFGCSNTCSCSTGTDGSKEICEQVGGQCKCKVNVEGRDCDTCKHLHYNLDSNNTKGCTRCNCGNGTRECDRVNGGCTCKENVDNADGQCTNCLPNHYGVNTAKCEKCSCEVRGIQGNWENCTDSTGQCHCKEKVQGRRCDECMDGYYNLIRDNTRGCSNCNCNKVGRMSKVCDKGIAGLCMCRENLTAPAVNRFCDPIFIPDKLEPDFGPESGNTTVTVKGKLFKNAGVVVDVAVGGNSYSPLSVHTDESLEFQTPRKQGAGKVTVTIRWAKVFEVPIDQRLDFTRPFTFTYKPDPRDIEPKAIRAFESGGCKISIKGTNLDSVSQPKLIVYTVSGTRLKTEECTPISSGEILCNSPAGFSNGQTLFYGLQFDGFTMYEDYKKFNNKSKIEIVIDPKPTREIELVQEYKPLFDTELKIEGQQFTSGCSDSDFRVVLRGSSSVHGCTITSRQKKLITCEPDIGFPGVNEEVMMMLYIGGNGHEIQKVKLHTFWNTWQFVLIAIGGSVFLLLVTLLPIILCCCCRNKRKQTFTNSNGHSSNGVSSDSTPLNLEDINLFPSQDHPRARPNSYEGVQLEKECWDNFIHKMNQSVRKLLKASHTEKSDIVVGTRCIKKGKEIRIIDGSFAQGTGKTHAGRPAMIKTLIKSYSSFDTDLLPEWINTGLQECLRFRDAFDDNILRIQGVATDKDRFFVMYMGYKRSLKDYLNDKSITPTKGLLLNLCVQVMEGVQFLHNIDIVHKDLAARNCVVCDDDRVQVSDAGFSWDLYPEEYMYDDRREKYLPVRWMAPESLSSGYYDKSSDVWSYAVLVWEVMSLSMYLPYHDVPDDSNIQSHITNGYRLAKPENASDALYEAIMLRCWEQQSNQRLQVSEIGDKFEQILNPGSAIDPTDGLYYNDNNDPQADNIYTNYAYQ